MDAFNESGNHIRTTKFETDLALIGLGSFDSLKETLFLVGKALWAMADNILNNKFFCCEQDAKVFFGTSLLDCKKFGTLREDAKRRLAEEDIIKMTENLLTDGKTIPHIINAFFAVVRLIKNTRLRHAIVAKYKGHEYDAMRNPVFEKRPRDRGRIKKKEKRANPLTPRAGICPGYYSSLREDGTEGSPRKHSSAVLYTRRNEKDPTKFGTEAHRRDIPFVAGPSGCMMELTCFVKLIKDLCDISLTEEQFKEFVFAIASYSVCAGAHSFHEVMAVARELNREDGNELPYEDGQYLPSLPQCILNSEKFYELCTEYPDIVSALQIKEHKKTVERPEVFSTVKVSLGEDVLPREGDFCSLSLPLPFVLGLPPSLNLPSNPPRLNLPPPRIMAPGP